MSQPDFGNISRVYHHTSHDNRIHHHVARAFERTLACARADEAHAWTRRMRTKNLSVIVIRVKHAFHGRVAQTNKWFVKCLLKHKALHGIKAANAFSCERVTRDVFFRSAVISILEKFVKY